MTARRTGRVARGVATAVLAGLALLWAAIAPAAALDYPVRPVRIVVPPAAGGSFDVLARILAEHLSRRWPQRAFVENRIGTGGNIGAAVVAKAEPDGYTLLLWNDSLLINPAPFKDVSYDPRRDFVPVSLSLYSPNVLAAYPATGFRALGDVLAAARARPRTLSYGSPGNGTPGHLSFEILKNFTGIDVGHVPYRSGGPAVADLVAGHIPLGMVAVAGAIAHIRAGALTGLAVTSMVELGFTPVAGTGAELSAIIARDLRYGATS